MHEEGTISITTTSTTKKKSIKKEHKKNHVCNLCNFLREICESGEKVFRHHFLKDQDCVGYISFSYTSIYIFVNDDTPLPVKPKQQKNKLSSPELLIKKYLMFVIKSLLRKASHKSNNNDVK